METKRFLESKLKVESKELTVSLAVSKTNTYAIMDDSRPNYQVLIGDKSIDKNYNLINNLQRGGLN